MSRLIVLALLLLTVGCAAKPVRVATFNTALSREMPGELLEAMQTPDDEQAQAVAAVIQAARPDVLLLQEFDHGPGYDFDGDALKLFQQNYLGLSQGDGLKPIAYEHVYLAPSNTGVPTGVDLNNDGIIAPAEGAEVGTDAYAADCHGWGKFPGQYAFVVLSKYPIDHAKIRTFQKLRWQDLPGHQMPPGYYSDEAAAVLRLSSKNHVDVPIDLDGEWRVHLLASHPTPPVFDGPEDRNGRRNFDEIALWSLIVSSTWGASWNDHSAVDAYQIPPDQPHLDFGGPSMMSTTRASPILQVLLFWIWPAFLSGQTYVDAPLLVLGDLNADPYNGDSRRGAIQLLLGEPRLSPQGFPRSEGGTFASQMTKGLNENQVGDPAADTADWNDERGPGNLRVDYVLPSNDLEVVGSGVFWPTPNEPLMGVDLATVEKASDHRLVWVDIEQ